ncbi:MAG: FecR domain-containing protein [Bacteroidetes bacterium]|nr:FecR domain-containing protein [Bacteroidota bacterium]
MTDKMDIKQLLERFHQGNTTPEENLLLQQYLTGNSKELDELAHLLWLEEPDRSAAMHADEVLNRIHGKLGFDDISQGSNNTRKSARIVRLVLRYAAIFIIGFGLAWLFRPSQNFTSIQKDASGLYKVNVAYGSKSTIELPDGSVVSLNSGSSLSYAGSFETGNRTVTLEGEAFLMSKGYFQAFPGENQRYHC